MVVYFRSRSQIMDQDVEQMIKTVSLILLVFIIINYACSQIPVWVCWHAMYSRDEPCPFETCPTVKDMTDTFCASFCNTAKFWAPGSLMRMKVTPYSCACQGVVNCDWVKAHCRDSPFCPRAPIANITKTIWKEGERNGACEATCQSGSHCSKSCDHGNCDCYCKDSYTCECSECRPSISQNNPLTTCSNIGNCRDCMNAKDCTWCSNGPKSHCLDYGTCWLKCDGACVNSCD